MKNLKDNAMMQEMSLQDMKDVNGGLVGVIFGLIITDIIMNPNSACEALKAGWNSWTNKININFKLTYNDDRIIQPRITRNKRWRIKRTYRRTSLRYSKDSSLFCFRTSNFVLINLP